MKPKSKKWIITTPSSERIEIKNLLGFCKEHNLSPQCMYMVSWGQCKQHKGYTCKNYKEE